MTKNRKINVRALLLLFTYLVSTFPFAIFHHHESKVVAYEKASHCEKYIYYGDAAHKCNHSSHISKTVEKCSLCDDHTLSPHAIQHYFISFYSIGYDNSYNSINSAVIIRKVCSFSNRGPPLA